MNCADRFAAVAAAARQGDPSAWHALVGEISPRVLELAGRLGHPDPDEILAEVFVGVARRFDRFTGAQSDFHAWVDTIARRRIIDWTARASTRREQVCDLPPLGPTEVSLERSEDLDELASLLDRLDERHRRVLVLRFVEGAGTGEVADALETSAANIRVMTHRALARLRVAAGQR